MLYAIREPVNLNEPHLNGHMYFFGDTPKLSPRRNGLPFVHTRAPPPLPSPAQLLIGPAFFGATTAHSACCDSLGEVKLANSLSLEYQFSSESTSELTI